MPIDAIELHLVAALQRYNSLQRRAETHREPAVLLKRALAELGTALEELRVAQGQLIEQRTRIDHLQIELQRQYERYRQLFDEMPSAYVVTKGDTEIAEVNKAASHLFNVSQRFLVGKTLSVFVSEERPHVLTVANALATEGGERELSLKLRPRERAPLIVRARVIGESGTLRWIMNEPGAIYPQAAQES